MKTFAAAVLLLALAPAARADELSPELLKRLAAADEVSSKAQDTGSYLLTVHGEELDKSGKATKTDDVTMRITHVDGQEKQEIVKEVKDGKDVTDEAKKKQADEEAKEAARKKADPKKKDDDDDDGGSIDASPFAAKTQADYLYTVKAPDADRPGLLHVHFEPKKPDTSRMAGEVWVDEATASIRHIEFHPSVNPTFVQKLEIKADLTFDPEHGNLPAKLEAEGEGGMLFIKKRFKATTVFSDWSFPK